MSQVETLAYIKLTDERRDELSSIMAKGNSLLKKWHDKYNISADKNSKPKVKKRIQFINFLYKKARQKPKDIVLFDFTIPKVQVEQMFAVKYVELEILHGYAAFILKSADKYAKLYKGAINSDCNTFEDYYDECILQAQNAIFGYLGDVKFITYLGKTLRREILRLVNKSNFFCALTNECLALRVLFEKAKFDNPNATLDEIFAIMELTNEQKDILLSSYRIVNLYSNMQHSENTEFNAKLNSKEESIIDINGPGPDNSNHHVSSCVVDKEKFMDWSVLESLTDIEREVIYNYCLDQGNWRKLTKIRNPATGKKYTPWGLSLILSRAIEKLQASFNNNKGGKRRGERAVSA